MYELTPAEQLPASAAAPDLSDAIRRLGEAFKELGRRLAEVLTAACREIVAAFRKWLDAILRRMNPRIYHLYKHAKKARARKKNYHRLMKELHRWLN